MRQCRVHSRQVIRVVSAHTVSSSAVTSRFSMATSRDSLRATMFRSLLVSRWDLRVRAAVRLDITCTLRWSCAAFQSIHAPCFLRGIRASTIRSDNGVGDPHLRDLSRNGTPSITLCSLVPGGEVLQEGGHQMSHRRLAAAVFFSAVIVAVLGLIVYTERSNATQTVSVLIVTHDVSAGPSYDAADVQLVQVRAQAGDFNYETLAPSAFAARFARNLTTNDILRADDLIASAAQSVIALTVETPPPLAPGDSIDIFAALAGDQQVLVGHDLIVNTVSGGSLTVLVPVADEASWIAVGAWPLLCTWR